MAKASSTRSSPIQFLACVTAARRAPGKPASREMEEHVSDQPTLHSSGKSPLEISEGSALFIPHRSFGAKTVFNSGFD